MEATTKIHPEALLDHMDFVRGLARSLLFDEHQVDDVVQQTWLAAVRRPPRKPGAVRSWLAAVASNLARNTRRDEGRRNRGREPGEPELRVPSTAEVVEREATRKQVVKAVLSLGEPYRSTVLLRYFEGYSPKQIAAQLGIPDATVRTRLRRGLEQLRGMLDDAHDGNRQAWCLQLVPLAALSHQVAAAAVPTAKAVWVASAAAALVLTGTGIAWACIGDGDGPVGVEPEVAAARDAKGSLTGDAAAEARPGNEGLRKEIQTGGAGDGTESAMVGFRGRLVTPDGKPAANHRVRLAAFEPMRVLMEELDPGASNVRAPRIDNAAALTRTDGTFVLRGLWPQGHYVLHAAGDSPNFLTRVVTRTPPPGEVVDLGDLALLAGVEITGRVEDADGEPVASALVWSTDLNGAALKLLMFEQADVDGGLIVHGKGGPRVHMFPSWVRDLGGLVGLPAVRTGADGSFRLRGMMAGSHVLVVHAASHLPYMHQRLTVRSGCKDVGRIRLRQGEEMQGEIVDHQGQPVAGAEVVVAPSGIATSTDLFGSLVPVDFARRPRQTDARGQFRFTGLPKGRVTVAVRRQPGDPWLVRGPVPSDGEFRCKLPAPVSLRVSLKSSAGRPLEPTFKLLQGEVRGELLLGNLYRPVDVSRRRSKNSSGDHVFSDLFPGTYTVVAEAKDHVLEAETVELESDLLVHVTLDAAAPLQVRIQNQRGEPVRGARVYARPELQRPWSRSVLLRGTVIPGWSWLPTYLGKTDAQGALEASCLAKGQVFLTVNHPAYGAVTRAVTLPGAAHVTLQDPGSLAGRFLDAEKPADPDRWVLGVRRSKGIDSEGPTDMPRLVESARDGRFLVAGLAPGEYEIEPLPAPHSVHSLNSLKDYVESDQFGFFVTRNTTDCEVFPARTTRLQLNTRRNYAAQGDAGARVTGTLFLDQQPGQGCAVSYHDRHNPYSRTEDSTAKSVVDTAGRFDLGRLKVGEYILTVMDAKGDTICRHEVSVKAGEDRVLALSLDMGSMRGMVFGPDSAPIRGAQVRAVCSGGGGVAVEQNTTTDADGRFELRQCPAGRYALHVRADKVGEGCVRDVEVVAGRQTEAPAAHMTAFVPASGKVDLQSFGLAATEAPVVILNSTGKWYQVRASPGGRFVFAHVLPDKYQVSVGGNLGKSGIWRYGQANEIEVGPQGAKDLELRKKPDPEIK